MTTTTDTQVSDQYRAIVPGHAHILDAIWGLWKATWSTPGGLWSISQLGGESGETVIVGPGVQVKVDHSMIAPDLIIDLLRRLGAIDAEVLADWERDLIAAEEQLAARIAEAARDDQEVFVRAPGGPAPSIAEAFLARTVARDHTRGQLAANVQVDETSEAKP
jgi:hypothetical protein